MGRWRLGGTTAPGSIPRALGLAMAAACVLAMADPAPAQTPVRVVGADQSTYRALRTGNGVLVDGTLSRDRRTVIATDIWRDNGRGAWVQSP